MLLRASMRSFVWVAALSLAACQGQAPIADGPDDSADLAQGACLFGTSWAQWDDGLPDLAIEGGWNIVNADTELWDGALEQMIASLRYPDGPETFAGVLAETDDGQFLWRELSDQRDGIGYIAWGYMGGDNFHGAVFYVEDDTPVALLGDPDVWACTVTREETSPTCSAGKAKADDSPKDATVLARTGKQVEVDAVDRIGDGSFVGADDTDWYRVDFAPANKCVSCFEPYAFVNDDGASIDELCVFVSSHEADKRGSELECYGGEPATDGELRGCCTSSPSSALLQLLTDWSHEAGEESPMYIRVKGSADTCETYSFFYGHFAG